MKTLLFIFLSYILVLQAKASFDVPSKNKNFLALMEACAAPSDKANSEVIALLEKSWAKGDKNEQKSLALVKKFLEKKLELAKNSKASSSSLIQKSDLMNLVVKKSTCTTDEPSKVQTEKIKLTENYWAERGDPAAAVQKTHAWGAKKLTVLPEMGSDAPPAGARVHIPGLVWADGELPCEYSIRAIMADTSDLYRSTKNSALLLVREAIEKGLVYRGLDPTRDEMLDVMKNRIEEAETGGFFADLSSYRKQHLGESSRASMATRELEYAVLFDCIRVRAEASDVRLPSPSKPGWATNWDEAEIWRKEYFGGTDGPGILNQCLSEIRSASGVYEKLQDDPLKRDHVKYFEYAAYVLPKIKGAKYHPQASYLNADKIKGHDEYLPYSPSDQFAFDDPLPRGIHGELKPLPTGHFVSQLVALKQELYDASWRRAVLSSLSEQDEIYVLANDEQVLRNQPFLKNKVSSALPKVCPEKISDKIFKGWPWSDDSTPDGRSDEKKEKSEKAESSK